MHHEVQHTINSAMTVGDLRADLEGYDDDMPVFFVCDYGDCGHTQQALPVEEVRELDEGETLDRSAYSQSRVALEEKDCGEEGDEISALILC